MSYIKRDFVFCVRSRGSRSISALAPILQDLKNFAETVTRDYIIREITKAKRTGGIAA